MNDTIRAIVVKPGERATAKDIDRSLSGLQAQVGGSIEALYPFEDKVGIICNEDAKLVGMAPNRAMRTEDGDIYDIICGNFLIVGFGAEDFQSLTPEQEKKYTEMFNYPERFVMKNGQIDAIPITGKMTFDEFRKKIIDGIKHSFIYEGTEVSVAPKQVEKANGSYEGISVSRPSSNVAMCLNLEPAYENLDISSVKEITADIFKKIKAGFEQMPEQGLAEHLGDYSWVRNYLAVEILSYEQHSDYLQTVPHTEVVGDLVAVYRIQISDEASTLITNNMLKAYGVSQEQLHADALSFSERNYPVSIMSMSSVLGAAFGQDVPDQTPGLYVCTSDNRQQGGAGVIAYSDFAEKAGEKISGDFFILPSSRHEILILPDMGADRLALENMVKTINATELSPDDILSNNVYHYDAKDRKLELAQDFESRQKNQVAEKTQKYDSTKRKGR